MGQDAPALPIPHTFGFNIWRDRSLRDIALDGLTGFTGPMLAYRTGEPPIFNAGPIGPGNNTNNPNNNTYCGSDRVWQGDGTPDTDPPLKFTWWGRSLCCLLGNGGGFHLYGIVFGSGERPQGLAFGGWVNPILYGFVKRGGVVFGGGTGFGSGPAALFCDA